MNAPCLTIEKTYMLRRSSQYKDVESKAMRSLEEALVRELQELFTDEKYTPPYWKEELDENKQRKCLREMTTLALAVCILVEEEQGDLDTIWFNNIRHEIETQLSDIDQECSYYVMLEAFLILRLVATPLKNVQPYWDILEQACKEKTRTLINDKAKTYEITDRKCLLDKFTMLSLKMGKLCKYTIDFAQIRPTKEMVLAAKVDWCFYTHGFKEQYMKAWIEEYAICEQDKSMLISNMEQRFEKMAEQYEKRRKEVPNEEMDDF